ncbi:MAG: S8 family serine peptidase [Candidatus Bathyarchaeota archaeon]|nr:S8 family serine peptidase [Candidatus Bathyarchaeota archaeon]
MINATNAQPETPTTASLNPAESFTPTVWKPAWIDQNNNAIADSLDQEIAAKTANNTQQDYVNVIALLQAAPTTQDAAAFIESGGYLTTQPWTEATYGFGGTIPYAAIAHFIQQCPNVLLVEKENIGKAHLAYATQQIGARTYVWNTMALQGDPNASTAIIDTGIDASHNGFSSSYGDSDFSKKIVGWNDQIGSSTTPIDDNGHGSHVAGLAAGNGFFSTDASGYATATWGANLGAVSDSGNYIVSGMAVNRTGPIRISVKWTATGTAHLSSIVLVYGDKTISTGSWSAAASRDTPAQNTIYSLTYNIDSAPTGGYNMYHVLLSLNEGTGDLYVTFNMSWPYTPPSDGFSAWTGVATQSKLVGVRVLSASGEGTDTELVNALNWIITNRVQYHITTASMSLGFDEETLSVNLAVLNLVNSGVTAVVAAGNSGSGGNKVYSPASVDEAITVAAVNQFDNIASYSSQGGTSRYTGKTIKPDIAAPGGSFYALPLFSVDTNYNDAEGMFTDVQGGDAASMQGTSMAAPIISGCVQILIQALGGHAKWNWTRSQALQPKMLLLMTATETYPNLREGATAAASPTLNRGGKDVHEGYGRVNLDAAVDAVLRTYNVGTLVTDTLGKPPAAGDISVLGQRLAWARNVQLIAGGKYNFSLKVPSGADYDLYLYNSTGTAYGEPAIVAKSVNATSGGIEQFWVVPSYTGTYYLVVKRATETTGSGAFTLSSEGLGAVNVTLNTPGLPNASNVVHYVQNGVAKTGNIVAGTFSDYADTGTTLTIDNPIYVSDTQRYWTTDASSFTVQSSVTFTVNYKTQYYISVQSSHGAPTASQWIDQGGSLAVSVTSPTETTQRSQQWICTGYRIDGGSLQLGNSYTFVNVQAAHTIEFMWARQFWIQVNSAHGAPTASAWVTQGESFAAAVTSPAEVVPNNSQWLCTGYQVDGGSLTAGTAYTFAAVEAAHTIEFAWKRQFYLTVESAHGTPGGGGWYDVGVAANAVLSSGTISGGAGVQYVFTGWGGDASGTGLISDGIIMNAAKTATANWKTQYYLTTYTAHGAVSGAGWYDSGANAFATVSPLVVTETAGTRHIFTQWSGDASGASATSNAITMTSPKAATANWKTQFYLELSANFGEVSPASGWYDAGSKVDISAVPPEAGEGERYVWNGWAGTGVGSYTGTSNSAQLTVNNALQQAASWTKQYQLTVTSSYGSPTPTTAWFNAGETITASVNSPDAATIVTQQVCTGWTGTGSAPASGATTSVQFTINQPSSITWKWQTNYLLAPMIGIVLIPIVLAATVTCLLLHRRRKRRASQAA